MIEEISEKHAGMLRDESRMTGYAEFIARPRDAAGLAQAVQQGLRHGMRITMQGAATGLLGEAVPQGGLLISTRGMNEILGLRERDGRFFLRVQAGVPLEQVEAYLRKPIHGRAHFFPPNPTEQSATLGGAFASDAVGTRGRVRGHISDVLRAEPHKDKYPGGTVLGLDPGAIPYIAELELALRPVPRVNWGVLLFFASPGSARLFARAWPNSDPIAGCAFFDAAALDLLREHHSAPTLPRDADEALYLELSGEDEGAVEERLAALLEIYLANGGREEHALAAEGLAEMAKFQDLCHAVPELMNKELDNARQVRPGLVKAALDRMYIDLDML